MRGKLWLSYVSLFSLSETRATGATAHTRSQLGHTGVRRGRSHLTAQTGSAGRGAGLAEACESLAGTRTAVGAQLALDTTEKIDILIV